MPVDPTTDPDFMKAAPHEQMAYLNHSDPDFAKASPQDQMGYLMHIRGLSPAISGPARPNVQMEPDSASSLREEGMTTDPKMGAMMNPESLSPVGASMAGGVAAAGPLLIGGEAAGITAGGMLGGLKTLASGALKAAPYVAASEAINYARQQLPGGKYIPPGAEMIPLFMSGGKQPEPEPTATRPPPVTYSNRTQALAEPVSPPPLRWPNQVPEVAPTQVAPPPVKYSVDYLKQKAAQERIVGRPEGATAESLESPYQIQNIPIKGATVPAAQGGPDSLPEMQPSQSTTISQHGYDPTKQQMTVQFKNGNIYRYSGVPQKVFDQYQASESQGSFHANNIKGRYTTDLIGKVKPSIGQTVSQALGGQQ